MRGTVYQRKNPRSDKRMTTWTFAVDIGRDAEGKRRRVEKGGYKTKRDAQTACRAFISHVETGGDPYPENISLTGYLEKWLEHQATRIRPTTLERYRTLLTSKEVQSIGGMTLAKIKPGHVQEVIDKLLVRGLAPRTVIQARAALSSAMRQAVAWGLIPTNPVQAVKPPRAERPKLQTPTPQQVIKLMEASVGTTWEIPVLLACTTGARRSEILGLSWKDVEVDLLRGRIRITRSLQKVAGETTTTFLDPKTSRARREIVLPPVVAARLRAHRAEQLERRMALGPAWHDHDLVCDRGDGAPLYPDSFSEAFKKLAAVAGLPEGVRLHDLRHAYATTLLERGVHPAIASATLGHASPAFTMNVYQHVLDGMTQKSADAITAALEL